MGFAYPRLRAKHSALAAAILLGAIHVTWHLAGDYLGGSGARGAYWLPHFLAFCAAMIAMRVLVVWVYADTGSLLLAQGSLHAAAPRDSWRCWFQRLCLPRMTRFSIRFMPSFYGWSSLLAAAYGRHLLAYPGKPRR